MKFSYYLDRPYNPDIDPDKVKEEIRQSRVKKKIIPTKILNPKATSLYLFFSPEKGIRIKHRTSIKVQPRFWDFKLEKIRSVAPGSIELNNTLTLNAAEIVKTVQRERDRKGLLSLSDYKRIVSAILDSDESFYNPGQLTSLFEKFKSVKSVHNTTGTIQEYKTVFKAVEEYESTRNARLTLSDFDQDFFFSFEEFLSKKQNPKNKNRGLLNDTIHKYISTLKGFLSWCRDNGHIVHPDAFKIRSSSFKRKSHNEIVVLSEEELQKLVDFDLSEKPKYERVRDIFAVLSYTGQRISDVMSMSKSDFSDNKWTFLSEKVKKIVVVPFNGYIANALPIIEKYNYKMPSISTQKFNDYIKEVGELIGIDSPVKITRFNGKNKVVIEKPKYQFMTSHMGRRTMVTILLSKGVPISLVQKITQHSDIRTLMKYESADTDSLIDVLNNI